jgi:YegS/Rv2252/BmrU family lipid kinase
MEKQKIVFIINPRAGIGYYKRVNRLLKQHLDTTKYDYELATTQYRGHGYVLAMEAVQNGTAVVVAVGGDGTINEIARALIGKETVFGFIPTGSGNGLAHHLKMPLHIVRAIKVINEQQILKIDTLEINNKACISIAGMGFDAYIAELFDKSSRRGLFPYLNFVVQSFFTYQPRTYIVEADGEQKEHTALMISIANSSQWGFNVKISPQASIQDGYADICFAQKPPLFRLIPCATKLLTSSIHLDNSAVAIYRYANCTVYEKENENQPFHIDGDCQQRQAKLEVKVLPQSLKTIVPSEIITNRNHFKTQVI